MYLEGCLPKPFFTKETKTTWLPNQFCGTHHQAQQPNNSFLFLLLYLSRGLSSCHPQESACMNTFYQGVPAAFLPRAQCKPCPFSKDCKAQVGSNIASQVPPALSTRTAVNPFNKDWSQTLTYWRANPLNKDCSESFQQGLKPNPDKLKSKSFEQGLEQIQGPCMWHWCAISAREPACLDLHEFFLPPLSPRDSFIFSFSFKRFSKSFSFTKRYQRPYPFNKDWS